MEALERVKEWLDSKTNLKHVYRRLQLAARFLIVGTFADDAIRVTCDYGGQISTMVSVGFPSAAATVMPAVFIVTQATGVFLVLSGRAPEQGCMTLLVWTAIHPFLYLQQKNLEFLLESVTIIGGLLILLSSERNLRKRQEAIELQARPGERAALVGGDEEVAEQREEAQEQTDRLQLGGRVAVSAVFVYYVVKMLHERIGVLKGVVPEELHVAVVEGVLLVLLLIATGLLVVGMKARWCALLLAVTMFLAALYKHPWVRRRRRAGCAAAAARPARPPARLPARPPGPSRRAACPPPPTARARPRRQFVTMWSKKTYALDFVIGYEDVQVDAWLYSDHQRYFFFQQISTVGALLQLVVHGPGRYSLDEQDGPVQVVTLTSKGMD
jgi:uncharacterized membrane protein YphA (DoxX/SURF4 family)